MRPLKAYLVVEQRRRRKTRWQNSLHQQARRAGWGIGALIGLGLVSLVLAAVLAYASLTRDLPSPAMLSALLDPPGGLLLQPTRIYDRSGQHLLLSLDSGLEGQRQVISLDPANPEHLPEELVTAIVATADPGFWNHPGFLWSDLMSSRNATLAERLVSDLLLSNEPPSLARNLRVRILAAQVTAIYGREKVLEWYLNSANYGHLAFGAEAAARLYLGKPASQLNLAEAALLAAVAQAPALNPLDTPDAARANQRQAVASLLASGAITKQQADQALATPLVFQKPAANPSNPAVAFTNLVEDEVARLVGQARLERGGLEIRTTLDYDLQLQLTCTLRTQLLRIATSTSDAAFPGDNSGSDDCPAARLLPTISFTGSAVEPSFSDNLTASGVILDPQTGQVLAMVGDINSQGVESPVMSAHASGSLLTPFIYLAGFTRGMSPATLVWDIPSSLPPALSDQANPDGKFHGPVRLRMALANDYLAPAAQLLAQIGPDVVWSSTAPFGLPSLTGESVPFSGGSLSPLQAAQAFGVLANQGVMAGQAAVASGDSSSLQLSALLQVQDSASNSLLDWTEPAVRPIISAPLAYLVNQILSDEPARWPSLGSSNALAIGRQAAAKLGQTADGQDSWTVGYTPQRVSVVWLGMKQGLGSPVSSAGGGTNASSQNANPSSSQQRLDPRWAAGAWHALMQYASRDLPVTGWTAPPGISTVNVCDPSGLLPTAACPSVVSEVFLTGNEPTTGDNLYQTFEINSETGRLATVFTPPSLVVEKTYLVTPPEARPWAEASGLPVPPEQYDDIQAPPILPDVHITLPGLFTVVRGAVKISGTAAGENFASYQVQVGHGLNPEEWIQVGDLSSQAVTEGTLATWDSTQVDDGLYAVRLVVVRQNQQVETAVIQVTVDNTPPTVSVPYPVPGQVYATRPGQAIILQAQVSDAIGLARVEWWVDGSLVGSMDQPPFSLPWEVTPGSHSLIVKAYDLAGNEGETPPVPFSIGK
jgi:membrane peptidoglycan carboxypeptidase